MVAPGRPALRDLFDDAPTPLVRKPPRTHHLDYYVATDGSYRPDGGGLGAIIETRDGRQVERLARADRSPDNNVAEYRALHLGLDVLATRIPPDASVGVLVDHTDLATNVNSIGLVGEDPTEPPPARVVVPERARRHWRGIHARLAGLDSVRAACLEGHVNPAHALANEPDAYRHLASRPVKCELPTATPAHGTESVPVQSPPPGYPSD